MRRLYLIIFLGNLLFASYQEDFLKTLNEVSEIATKTKLNIDKTPSNVEVINRNFIVKSGARTLLDLLQYLPGIGISMSASGKREIVVRGNKSLYRDKIKFLINGHEVTNNLYSNQFYYYNFPASLIKRIEFTKTPDAILYGDKAYLGVINIITLNQFNTNQFSLYQSSNRQTTMSLFDKLNDKLLIDAHYEISDPIIKKRKIYLVDMTKSSKKGTAIRDVRPNELEKEIGIGIRYKKDNSTISYRFQYFQKGNFFGLLNLPPLIPNKHVNLFHQFLNYNNSKFITDNIKNNFNLGVINYQWKGAYRAFPVDFNFSNPNSVLIGGANIKEIEYYIRNRTTYITNKHTINFILEAKYSKPYEDDYFQYIVGTPKNYEPLFNKKINRKIYSAAIEDLYIINDNLSIIYGGRYSYYNDFGDDFSYKLGSVYNLNSKTTFKLLFNTAFRAPSWIELYANTVATFHGNENLQPEKIKMLEFSLLQKIFNNDKLKITYYKGKSKNYIMRIFSTSLDKEIYENSGDLIIKGFEISYKKFYRNGNFNINYSYNNNKNQFNSDVYYNNNINRARKRWIKAYNIYNFSRHMSFFTGAIYGSKVKIPKNNTPNDYYFTLNINLNFHKKNFNFIIGVDNLTNHKNYYIVTPSDIVYSKYYFMPEKSRIPTIGRKIYLTITKKW